MNGFQLTFFTQQDRSHRGEPLAQWLLRVAADIDIHGATVQGGIQGVGHDGRMHAITLFDLSSQPVQVVMVLSTAQADALLARLASEAVRIFFVKAPVVYGWAGQGGPLNDVAA